MASKDASQNRDVPPIAILGIGCRFPGGVADTESLWSLLAEGCDTWSETPPDRFNEQAFLHPNPDQDGAYSHRGGHFLQQDISAFDADFFQIPRVEASALDPEQRLSLETTYEALENAGLALERIRGSRTSVYFANFTHDYDRNIYKDPMEIPKYHTTGSGQAIISNRLSYFFDFKGPSMTLDTGCSGGIVAIHQACQSLRSRETDMSIAGGVNLIMSPDHMLALSKMHMLNENGKSYSFDARGSGYGRGEGCATVVLKRLDDALLAGDPVRAVIRNTGVNQDGKTHGITLPNEESQAFLASQTYAKASMNPAEVDYIEAHGTGTAAGDLAEVNAIAKVFGKNRLDPLLIGSIKSNIGHLEACSGLAGLIKAVLVLEKGEIPPTINHETPRPELKLHERNIKIPTELLGNQPIQQVSVSSFGYGGTNGHLVLGKLPSERGDWYLSGRRNERRHEQNDSVSKPYLLVLSTTSRPSMTELIKKLGWWTSFQNDGQDLADLAYTLSTRRSVLDWRLSLVAKDSEDLKIALSSEALLKGLRKSKRTKTVFLFTGQGAQWHAMGFELMKTSWKFRSALENCQVILQSLGAPWNLIEELSHEKSKSRIGESKIAQPATTALQLALVDCLRDVGVKPRYVIGHSSGEIAAAYAAGILSIDSAMTISYHRGFMSDVSKSMSSKKGAMLAVGLGEEEIEEHVKEINSICVGCVNSSQSVTLSGDEDGINKAKRKLDGLSIFNRAMKVDTAYHSQHMQHAAYSYLESLGGLRWQPPDSSIHFISSVTGQVKTLDFGPTYWVDNLTSKVRYHHAISEVCRLHETESRDSLAFIELGPHAALSGPTAQTLRGNSNKLKCSYQSALYRDKPATETLLQAVGNLFVQGCDIKIERAYKLWSAAAGCVLSHLPTYPWDQSTQFWHESRLSRNYRLRRYPYHDLIGVATDSSTPLELSWRCFISTKDLPWLSDHVVNGLTIFPGSGYLCMAIEAMRQINDLVESQERRYKIVLKNVRFSTALVVPKAPDRTEMLLHVNQYSDVARYGSDGDTNDWYEFRISALANEAWNLHCRGFVKVDFGLAKSCNTVPYRMLDTVSNSRSDTVANDSTSQKFERWNASVLYENLRGCGNDYGPCFSAVEDLKVLPGHKATSSVRIPDIASAMPASKLSSHMIHPTTLDALMHASLALYYELKDHDSIMPLGLEEMSIFSDISNLPEEKFSVNSNVNSERARRGRYALAQITAEHPRPGNGSTSYCIEIRDLELRGLGAKPRSLASALTMHQKIEWTACADYNPAFSIDGPGESRFPTIASPDAEPEAGKSAHRPIEFIMADVPKETHMHSIIHVLFGHLTRDGHKVSSRNLAHTWQHRDIQKTQLYVVVESSSKPIMSGLTLATFSNIIQLMRSARDVLWITVKDPKSETLEPERDLISGFARSAHAESEDLRLVRVDVQQSLYSTFKTLPKVVADVIHESFDKTNGTLYEREYVFNDDQLYIPRLVTNKGACDWLIASSKDAIIGPEQFQKRNGQERLTLRHAYHGTDLTFEPRSHSTATPLPHEVEIQSRAISLDPGALNNTTKCSHSIIELAGEVTSVGQNVSTVSVGDRVCAWAFTLFSNCVRVPAQNVHKLPNLVSSCMGASLPMAFAAAYCCYANMLVTKNGKLVLINHAMSDIGQALLTLAEPFGLKIVAVVKNESEVELIVRSHRAQLLAVLTKRSSGFAEELRVLTKGSGVFAVVNCSTIDAFEEGVACLAPFGTFVQLEYSGQEANTYPRVWRSSSNLKYSHLNIARLLHDHPKRINESLANVVRWLDRKGPLPISITVFPVDELNNAVQKIENGGHIGKLVTQIAKTSNVSVARSQRPHIVLESHATYVIAGGLGYIGRRMCRLLVERGAKHLVVLSRRIGSSHRQQELEQDLRAIETDLVIYWKQCDIGDRYQVDRVSRELFSQEVPPVKGIVQATVVLQDCTLENMTLYDYEVSLHNKVHGTKNLKEALSNHLLSFFLSLSSTTGVVGSRGQANYSAANTYLDSVANSAPKSSQSHYVTVDIGMVHGSDVNETTSTMHNLTRQGLTTIEMKELIMLLEYAISPECKRSGCNQIVSGIEAASIARVNIPNSNARSAMFSDMLQDVTTGPRSTVEEEAVALKDSITEAKDMQEVHGAAIKSMSKKLTEIVASSDHPIDPESSMTSLGLDSLITMELRSWISKEFAAVVSTAEILDHSTLRALAEHVVTISETVKKAFVATDEIKGEASDESELSAQTSSPHVHRANYEELPTLPFPGLHGTMRQMQTSRESFMTPPEQERLQQVIDHFCAPSGAGTRLQQRLLERSQDVNLAHWQEGLYSEPIYLARRESLYPNTIFFAGHLVRDDVAHSQARRAAIISAVAFNFKQRLKTGLVSPDTLNEEPLSMSTWKWLFNGSREPRNGVDKMRLWRGDNLIVLRRGHVFMISLKAANGEPVSVADLEATFVELMAASEETIPAIATLTSEDRDTWAKSRYSLMQSDQRNTSTLRMIEEAAFVVALDNSSPKTPSQRCNQFFLGDSSNRWTDKTMHFVVCENGVSAMVCEHSMLDGLSVKSLHAAITEGIMSDGASTSPPSPVDSIGEWQVIGSKASHSSSSSNSPTSQPSSSDGVTTPSKKEPRALYQELHFHLSDLHARISYLQSDFKSRYAPIELTHYSLNSITANTFRSLRISPKIGFQLVIQLACLRFYNGEQPESWEAVSLARFHQGRVDWIQAVDTPMKDFCSAAAKFKDGGAKGDRAVLKDMLLDAAASYTNRMTNISRGHGFVAHLYALLALAQQEQSEHQTPLPALFQDPQWTATSVPSVKRVKTDCVEGLDLQETCFLMPRPECVYVHFEPRNDGCVFFVQTWVGFSQGLCEAIGWAAETVGEILG